MLSKDSTRPPNNEHKDTSGNAGVPVSALKLVNCLALSFSIFGLCLLPTFFAVRALMPFRVQQGIYASMLRHPAFGEFVSIAFVAVLNLGALMCVAAFALNTVFIFIKGLPNWLKVITTLFVLAAILGRLTVGSAVHPTSFK